MTDRRKRALRSKFALTLHLLESPFLIRDYGTAYAMSEIITQADVSMKKLIRNGVFSSFEPIFYVV